MDFPVYQVWPLLGMIAAWGVGLFFTICGFTIYIFKFAGRGVAREIKAGSLPVANFLFLAGKISGVIGILLGLLEWWQVGRH